MILRYVIFVVFVVSVQSGCNLGPRQIDNTRVKYNESIRRTSEEEMLLNLVRLRYRESPRFMNVAGVSAQYTFTGGIGTGWDIPESALDTLKLSGSASRAEKPTITYAPLQDEAFHRGLLSPISVDSLGLLLRTGWRWDRVLPLAVQNMNRVDNATSAGGPTPNEKPEFEDFRFLSQNFQRLREMRGLELASASRKKQTAVHLPAEKVDADFVLNAIQAGYTVGRNPSTGQYVLSKSQKYVALQVSNEANHSDAMQHIRTYLNLKPNGGSYEVKIANDGQIQPDKERGAELRDEITVSTRSILEIMFYLSQGVEVPDAHMNAGIVTITRDGNGDYFDWARMFETEQGSMFQVHVAEERPKCAAVAVEHCGYWHYIDNRDLGTLSTFSLLLELYNIEVQGGGGSHLPVLTLGV